MYSFIEIPDLTLAVVALSVVLSPTLCGWMAHRISRTYEMRNAD